MTKTKETSIEQHTQLFNKQRLDRTKRIIERVQRAIDDEVFYPSPSPTSCGSCPFREPCRKWPG